MKCSKCLLEFEDGALFCPHCGAKVRDNKRAIAFVLTVFILFIITISPVLNLFPDVSRGYSLLSISNMLYIATSIATIFFFCTLLMPKSQSSKKLVIISLSILSITKLAMLIHTVISFNWFPDAEYIITELSIFYLILLVPDLIYFSYILLYGAIKNISIEKTAGIIYLGISTLCVLVSTIMFGINPPMLTDFILYNVSISALLIIYPVLSKPILPERRRH